MLNAHGWILELIGVRADCCSSRVFRFSQQDLSLKCKCGDDSREPHSVSHRRVGDHESGGWVMG